MDELYQTGISIILECGGWGLFKKGIIGLRPESEHKENRGGKFEVHLVGRGRQRLIKLGHFF